MVHYGFTMVHCLDYGKTVVHYGKMWYTMVLPWYTIVFYSFKVYHGMVHKILW